MCYNPNPEVSGCIDISSGECVSVHGRNVHRYLEGPSSYTNGCMHCTCHVALDRMSIKGQAGPVSQLPFAICLLACFACLARSSGGWEVEEAMLGSSTLPGRRYAAAMDGVT